MTESLLIHHLLSTSCLPCTVMDARRTGVNMSAMIPTYMEPSPEDRSRQQAGSDYTVPARGSEGALGSTGGQAAKNRGLEKASWMKCPPS